MVLLVTKLASIATVLTLELFFIMTVYIHWTVIVLPILLVLVAIGAIVVIWCLHKTSRGDIQKSKDGHAYRILDI